MTGATYITATAKNTSAETFMRSEQGATHSASDVAGRGPGRFACTEKVRLNLPPDERAQTSPKSTVLARGLRVNKSYRRVAQMKRSIKKAVSQACKLNTLTQISCSYV